MIKLIQTWIVLLPTLLTSACFAQTHRSDQLIERDFQFIQDWTEILFEKPLVAEPHVQVLRLVACDQQYKLSKVGYDKENYFLIDYRFERLSDGTVIEPQIKIIVNGKTHSLWASSSGYFSGTESDRCASLGYTLPDEDRFIYPQNTKIEGIMIKANTSFNANILHWSAVNYWRVGSKSWADIHPSEIYSFND